MSTENADKPSNLRPPWQKGQSGNPLGRPPKGQSTAEKLRAGLAADLPEILQAAVAQAKAGDAAATRLILDRVLPPLKAIEMPVEIGELTGSMTEHGASILQAMACGVLAPGQAAQLLAALAAQAKIIEVDQIAQRLAALEQKVGFAGKSA